MPKALTVLNVAYPFAPVSTEAIGGSEQILSALDEALTSRGHHSLVLACEGSTVSGELIEVPVATEPLSPEIRQRHYGAYRAALAAVLRRKRVDVVHFHGVDFHEYEPQVTVPILCTLHLPPDWYPASIFQNTNHYLQCVSRSQRAHCPRCAEAPFLEEIPNGVDLARFRPARVKAPYALVLGRICPEKGIHLALDAARLAGLPLIIAGRVFPYPIHERYFAEEIQPRLDAERRFIGPVVMPEKAALLAGAQCLVVSSLVAETSSLVAMEALASGTPVVAFGKGALPEMIAHGRTGFLAGSVEELAQGMSAAARLDPRECRRDAEHRFSLERMTTRYLTVYERLAAQRPVRRSRPPLRLDEIRSGLELAGLRDDWLQLWERSARATVFQRPEWLLAWRAHVHEGDGMRVVALRRGAALVGLAPLFVWRANGSGPRTLSLMGAGVSDYQDALLADDEAAACLAALQRWLGQQSGDWDRVELSELREDAWLLRADLGGFAHRRVPQDTCTGIALAGPARFEQVVPAGKLKHIREARRRAARDLQLELVNVIPEGVAALVSALAVLHGRRWRERGLPGMLAGRGLDAFHRDVAHRLLERGMLLLLGVRLGGTIAAVIYGFHDRSATRFYLSGFDPRFSAYSPGMLALAQAMESSLGRGARLLDFLRGTERYKYDWGARDLTRIWRRTAERPAAKTAPG